MNNQNIPRLPIEAERKQLFDYLYAVHFFDGTDEDMPTLLHEAIGKAAIAVYDNFVADFPAYTGKIMMVVWANNLAQYEVFTWNEHGLEFVEWEP